MGFSDKKRTWLVGQLGEAEVARLENDTDAMKAALEAKGGESKDAPAAEGAGDDKTKAPGPRPSGATGGPGRACCNWAIGAWSTPAATRAPRCWADGSWVR